jgi:hypothetical protein
VEEAMTDRDLYRKNDALQAGDDPQSDSTTRASSQRALWSWIAGLAIVFVLFILFYGLDSRRESRTLTTSAPPATTTVPTTTGKGGGTPQQNDAGSPSGAPQGQGAPSGQGAR